MAKFKNFNNRYNKEDNMREENQQEQEADTSVQEEYTAQNTEADNEITTENNTQQEQVVNNQPQQVSSTNATKLSSFATTIKFSLDNYKEEMDPKKAITSEEGGAWQYGLYKTIKSIFELQTQEEFNESYSLVLDYFNTNKNGLFNELYMFRFPESWKGGDREFTQFRRLIYTMMKTADKATRTKELQSINFDLVTEGMSQQQRQYLLTFYNL